MAEARSFATLEKATRGVHVNLAIDEHGLHLHTTLTIPPPRELLAQASQAARNLWHGIEYSFYPLAAGVWLSLTVFVAAAVMLSPPASYLHTNGLAVTMYKLSEYLPWLPVPRSVRLGVLAAHIALAAMLLAAQAERVLLRLLLSDTTYLYDARAPSARTRMWLGAVRCLTRRRGGHPHPTYAFQRSLPRLPVPPLARTVEAYLASTRLLQAPSEFAATEAAARAFLAGDGPALQRYLTLKSWLAPNYVSDWWERYVYLRSRAPLAIGSNYYVLDSGRSVPSRVPEARAAVLIHAFCSYRSRLLAETIEPVCIADGAVPLDMEQCRRMFGTVRVPGRELDALHHYGGDSSRCVAVLCRGSFYALPAYRSSGELRGPDELEDALAAIKRDAASAVLECAAEAMLPALTTMERTRWAEAREAFFSEGVNRRSLHAVESALFVVALAEDTHSDEEWTARGLRLLGGARGACDVWFDKSITLVVMADGHIGLNVEHSWADAPTISHMMETCLLHYELGLSPYHADGHVRRLSGSAGGGAWSARAQALGVSGADAQLCTRRRRARLEVRAADSLAASARGFVRAASGDLQRLLLAAASPAASGDGGSEHSGSGTPRGVAPSSPLPPPGGPLALHHTHHPSSSSPPELDASDASGGDVGADTAAVTSAAAAAASTALGTPSTAASSASASSSSPPWARLTWSLSRAAEAAIVAAQAAHVLACDDVDLVVAAFSPEQGGYGKAFMKRCRTSPDAYIQAAMCLAYKRDQGKFDAVYEACTTRVFLHGRTETVRPLTQEAVNFVRTMDDPSASAREKLRALQVAAARHVLGFTDAMAGRGCDRHLFALHIVAVGKGVDAPFLKRALSVPWQLSTSQTPQQQTTLWDPRDPAMRDKASPGGGFGPVSKTGYGVSYMVAGDSEIFFHVSSIHSALNTDSKRFLVAIFTALGDMQRVLLGAVEAEEAVKARAAAAAAATVAAAAAATVAAAAAAAASASAGDGGDATGSPTVAAAAAVASAAAAAAAATHGSVDARPSTADLPLLPRSHGGIGGYTLGTPALGPLASPAVVPTPLPDSSDGGADSEPEQTAPRQPAVGQWPAEAVAAASAQRPAAAEAAGAAEGPEGDGCGGERADFASESAAADSAAAAAAAAACGSTGSSTSRRGSQLE